MDCRASAVEAAWRSSKETEVLRFSLLLLRCFTPLFAVAAGVWRTQNFGGSELVLSHAKELWRNFINEFLGSHGIFSGIWPLPFPRNSCVPVGREEFLGIPLPLPKEIPSKGPIHNLYIGSQMMIGSCCPSHVRIIDLCLCFCHDWIMWLCDGNHTGKWPCLLHQTHCMCHKVHHGWDHALTADGHEAFASWKIGFHHVTQACWQCKRMSVHHAILHIVVLRTFWAHDLQCDKRPSIDHSSSKEGFAFCITNDHIDAHDKRKCVFPMHLCLVKPMLKGGFFNGSITPNDFYLLGAIMLFISAFLSTKNCIYPTTNWIGEQPLTTTLHVCPMWLVKLWKHCLMSQTASSLAQTNKVP